MLPHARDPPATALGMSCRRPHNGDGHIRSIIRNAPSPVRATTNHIWTVPGLQGSLFRIDWAGEDCSHISGLRLRNMHSSGPDGIGWLTPHQGHELWVRGSYQVWSTTVFPVSPSRLSLPVQSVGGPA